MFRQVRKITIDELIFDFEELDIEFEIDLKDNLNSDIAKVYIYNLSKETKEKLKKNQGITIETGYVGNSGIIYSGTVDKIFHEPDEFDIKTTLICTPSNNLFTNTLVNIQFNKGIKASEILRKLETIIPYKIKILEIPHDVIYMSGKAFSHRLSSVIKIICDDIRATGTFEKNNIIIKAPGKAYTSVIKVGSENGLISISKQDGEKVENKYIMETLIFPELTLNQTIEVDSIYLPGKYIIREINYIAKDINTFIATSILEVMKL